jgi:hypothetical protein
VLEVCPEYARFSSDAEGIRKSFEGSSLETIKHMVASGMGITVVPALSVPQEPSRIVRYVRFAAPVPTRRVVLAWRRTFTRYEAIAALRNAIYACELEGVTRLTAEAAPSRGTPVPSPPPAGADAMQRQHAADLRRSVPQSRSFRRIVSIDSLANIHFHWLSIGRSLLLRRPVAGIVLEAGQRIEVARVAAAA